MLAHSLPLVHLAGLPRRRDATRCIHRSWPQTVQVGGRPSIVYFWLKAGTNSNLCNGTLGRGTFVRFATYNLMCRTHQRGIFP
jgi:hypothetical protein